jgi:multidrug efflux pump subunit AcrA (membrane-fusion protein)
LLIFLLTATALAGATACRTEDAAAAATKAPPPAVAFVSVSPEPVAITSEWIATLDGTVNAQIRPQVSGYLVQRTYREGAFVRKGDVLFEIDRRPFETALNQANARLAESQAQLAKAERLPRVNSTTTSAPATRRRRRSRPARQPSRPPG